MEIKKIISFEDLEEMSHAKKIQPIIHTFFKENYDIILEEIEWDKYFPGDNISKYA